jgi:4-amino-4-deoxy-L-arabinose transferase-like glycosyltransferase
MNRLRALIIPFLLFVFSLALRASLISKGPYHGDCLFLAMQSERTVRSGQLHFLHQHGYPLTAIMGAAFVYLNRVLGFTDPVLAVNVMSVFFSALAIPILYILVKILLDETAAVVSAVLFSLSPIFLSNSVYGNSHGISLFFMLTALVFLFAYFSKRQQTSIVFAGLCFGLSGAARLGDAAVMFFPLIFLMALWRQQAGEMEQNGRTVPLLVRDYLLFFLTAFFTVMVFYDLMANRIVNPHLPEGFGEYFRQNVLSLFKNYKTAYFLSTKYHLDHLSNLGLILAGMGFYYLFVYNIRTGCFLLTWFLIPTILMSGTVTVVPRYFIISILPLSIAQGFLFSRLIKVNQWFRVMAILSYAVLVFSLFSGLYPILKMRHDKAILPDYVRWITQKTEPNAKIIFPDGANFMSYYGARGNFNRPYFVFNFAAKELMRFKTELDGYLKQGIPIYITEIGLREYDPLGKFADFIAQNYQLELIGRQLFEDYHRGAIYQRIFPMALFRIHLRR